MASFIKIVLRGHIMSFGGDMVSSKWRGTNKMPTMSFVIGFLCSCLGISFRKELAKVKELRDSVKVHVVVLNHGRRIVDYQTAGTNYDLKDDLEKLSRVIKLGGGGDSDVYKKELLVDGKFDVIVEVLDPLLTEKLVSSLKSPKWMPFLGRKAYHLSDIPFGGVFPGLEEALINYPKGVVYFQQVLYNSEEAEAIKDYPLCEGDNRTTVRYIREKRI